MGGALDEICELLQTHPNRDKVVCLLSYTLKLWGSSTHSKPLLTASARLAAARSALRMFDSPSALRTALTYGLGTHDGPFWGAVGSVGCMLSLAYLTAEKMMFLLDTGVLTLSERDEFKVRTSHKLFWSLASAIALIKSLRAVHSVSREMASAPRRRCAPDRLVQAYLVTAKSALDVAHSVSWLPRGWLWGDRVPVPAASAVATASAVIALVIHCHGKRFNR